MAGSQTIAAIARQPEIEAKARQYFFLTVGLVEAMYFIDLLFMVVFVYVFAVSFALLKIISKVTPLQYSKEVLEIGDKAMHGEEEYTEDLSINEAMAAPLEEKPS